MEREVIGAKLGAYLGRDGETWAQAVGERAMVPALTRVLSTPEDATSSGISNGNSLSSHTTALQTTNPQIRREPGVAIRPGLGTTLLSSFEPASITPPTRFISRCTSAP